MKFLSFVVPPRAIICVETYNVTPRPERVYGMCNRRVTYVHQGLS